MPRASYTHCVIPGCKSQGSAQWVLGVHQTYRHYLCACGWVGVSFNQHVAQITRHRGQPADHILFGTSTYRPPTPQPPQP